jgi:phospholipid/cholesterol/gamma-HCH transport system permease protein
MRFSPEAYAKNIVASVQEYSLLCARAVSNVFSRPRYIADTFTQMDSIGVGSLPIVVLTGFFTGCVLALQAAVSLKEFGAVNMTGRLVSLSMVKEVTEQIDAMRALGTDPIRKLVTPRLVATIFMLFFLTIISDACGIAGGALVAVAMLRLNAGAFFHTGYMSLVNGDVVEGLTKPLFSGFIIATIGCYYGLKTTGGTRGVGRSTTQAVVVSSVLIILMDFLVTQLMIGIFGR